MPAPTPDSNRFWHSSSAHLAWPLAVLILAVAIPGLGVFLAGALTLVAILRGRADGSLSDLGIKPPDSWPKLIAWTALYGTLIQLTFAIVVEPWLGRMLNEPLDLTPSMACGVTPSYGWSGSSPAG